MSKIKKEFTIEAIRGMIELAEEFNLEPVKCKECGKEFYPLFTQDNARYQRFLAGMQMICADHTPIDLITDSLKNPQN